MGRRRAGSVFSVWTVFLILVLVSGVALNVPLVWGSGTSLFWITPTTVSFNPSVLTVRVLDDFEDGVKDTDSWVLIAQNYEANFTIAEEGGMLNATNIDLDGWEWGVGSNKPIDTSSSLEFICQYNTNLNETSGQESEISQHDFVMYLINDTTTDPELGTQNDRCGWKLMTGFSASDFKYYATSCIKIFPNMTWDSQSFSRLIEDPTPKFKITITDNTLSWYWVNDWNATPTTDVLLSSRTDTGLNIDSYYLYACAYPSGTVLNRNAGILHFEFTEAKSDVISNEVLTDEKLTFTVSTNYPKSITDVDTGTRGRPVLVSGATDWSYNETTKILSITAEHSSSVAIEIRWAGSIFIRPDGSIDPPTAPISSMDNITYTFTNNIYDAITVQRSNITIDGNGYTLQGLSGNGFYLYSGTNNVTIKSTNIMGFEYGILLEWSSNNTVSGNNITNNIYGGVDLFSSHYNTISGNNITNNWNFGVWLYDSSYSTISENNITNNFIGVRIVWSSDNILSENNIAENYFFGVEFDDSTNNKIFHNFIDNSWQVLSLNSTNVWDDGYPSGGNYWSDYYGADEKSGPNQDQPGSDGIGDTPYVIDADNRDRYPLMIPSTMPSEAYISVPYHVQIKDYYCGPAALEMLFDFYGPDVSQYEIADVARTAPDGTYTCDMVRAAHFSNLSTSVGKEMPWNITGYTARKLGYAAFERGGMTINELKSLIADGYPIIVLTTWHFRVAVGYNSTHITFQDSWYGEMFNMTYQEFDTDWDYSGHWGLFISPWKVEVSHPEKVLPGSVFNVTASITYPLPPLFSTYQYPASEVNATVTLPVGLSLVSGETAKKTVDTGDLAAGASANVTWTVHADSYGIYTISVEAEGKVTGFVPPLPSYPEPYSYEDRIGGFGQSVLSVPDENPPTTLDNYDGSWHTTDFTIILTANDDMSGVAKTYYKINDGANKTVSADGQPLITTEGANNTLEYWSVDNAGNEESHNILTAIKLDKTVPTGSIVINNNDTYAASTLVTLTMNTTDVTSGVAQMRFRYLTWSSWEPYATSKSWNLTLGDDTKTICVQYRDKAGLISLIYQDTIILDTTKPIANAGVDQTVNEDTVVTLDGSASTDVNGIATHTWTFTDMTPQTLTGKNTTYTFATPGTYTITLKVTDSAGNYATDTVEITVLDVTKPVANAGPDRTVNEDTPTTLDGSNSLDNVDITAYTWTFTDETTKTLTGEKPTYTFNTPGSYTVILNVTDAAGNWATDTMVITVLDITKPAANAGQDQTVNVGATITFDASASSDNVDIVSYAWDFGDQTTATGKTATHAYNSPGTYTVTLTVKDAAGNSAAHSITVTVLSVEAFPMWIIGAVIATIGIAVAVATLLLRKRR